MEDAPSLGAVAAHGGRKTLPESSSSTAKELALLPKHLILTRALIFAFLFLSVVTRLWQGFYELALREDSKVPGPRSFALDPLPYDLRMRWIEQIILGYGLDPARPESSSIPITGIEPLCPFVNVGQTYVIHRNVRNAVYPPWSYAIAELFVPRWPWAFVRWAFAAWDLLALLVTIWCTWNLASNPRGSSDRTLLVLCLLSMDPLEYCLGIGQFSILVLALLMGVMTCTEQGYPILGGVLLGLAMIKPHLAIPFFLLPLSRRHWRTVATALTLVVALSMTTSVRTHSSILALLKSSSTNALYNKLNMEAPGLLGLVSRSGLSYPTASEVLSVVGLVVLGLLLLRSSRLQLVELGGLSAVVALTWSYSRRYDHVLLWFPLLACYGHCDKWHMRYAFWGLCLTVWGMGSYDQPGYDVPTLILRILVAVLLLVEATRATGDPIDQGVRSRSTMLSC